MRETELNDSYFEETPAENRFNHKNPLVRFIERYRVNHIVKYVQDGGKVLELGCEACGNLKRCKGGFKVGLDISLSAIKSAPKYIPVVLGDARKTPFRTEEFDTIILAETLEHVNNPEKMISESKRLLKKGGRLVVTVPYETHITNVKSTLKKLGLMKLLFKGIPEGTTPYHIQFFTPKSIRQLIEKEFKIERVHTGPFPLVGPIIFVTAIKQR